MRHIAPGRSFIHTATPGLDACASAIGNSGVHAVSSPWLIAFLEEASHRAVRDFYEDREATVGTGFHLRHVAATPPNKEIIGHARLLSIRGRCLTFEVKAYQGEKLLMDGTHERVLINFDKFVIKAPDNSGHATQTPSNIDFYFDFHSPWCWFASLRIEALAARVGRQVVWKPMSLARLIDQIDGRKPLESNPAFVRWFKQDIKDTAESLGLNFSYHPRFPLRPARALRASLHAAESGCAAVFVQDVMAAYWSRQEDIEDIEVLKTIGRRHGLSPLQIENAISDARLKQAIEDNTAEAIERGVFGAPSFICEGKLFWGHDRMDFMERFLVERQQI